MKLKEEELQALRVCVIWPHLLDSSLEKLRGNVASFHGTHSMVAIGPDIYHLHLDT